MSVARLLTLPTAKAAAYREVHKLSSIYVNPCVFTFARRFKQLLYTVLHLRLSWRSLEDVTFKKMLIVKNTAFCLIQLSVYF